MLLTTGRQKQGRVRNCWVLGLACVVGIGLPGLPLALPLASRGMCYVCIGKHNLEFTLREASRSGRTSVPPVRFATARQPIGDRAWSWQLHLLRWEYAVSWHRVRL